MSSHTSQFLRNYRAATVNDSTHFSLTGGKYKVPDDLFDAFFNVLKKDVENPGSRTRNWLVERRTPVFRFFLDIDLPSSKPVDMQFWEVIIRCCLTSLDQFQVSSLCTTCYVTVVDPVKLDNGLFKNGTHLYFPYLYVNEELALQIRHVILTTVVAQFHSDKYEDTLWDTIIDRSVLTSNGIRLVYSHKARTCTCGRDRSCAQCDGTFHVDLGRPYKPVAVYALESYSMVPKIDLANEFRTNIFKTFQLTSVRAPGATPTPVVVPPHLASMPLARSVAPAAKRPPRPATEETPGADANEVVCTGFTFTRFDDSGIKSTMLQAINHSGLCKYEQKCKKLFREANGRAFLLHGELKYCNNPPDGPRNHSGQDVYYVATKHPPQLHQKCWSAKCDGRSCSVELSPIYHQLLFGEDFQDIAPVARSAVQAAASLRMQDVAMLQPPPEVWAYINVRMVAATVRQTAPQYVVDMMDAFAPEKVAMDITFH
jgi:hypothetical protein